jgi:hypothetical protein
MHPVWGDALAGQARGIRVSFRRGGPSRLFTPQRRFGEAAAITGLLIGSALVILLAGHGLNFRHDDWEVIQDRYKGGASSFLQPLNEHLSIVPIAIYRLLFHTAGIGSYFWYRLVLVAFDVACGYCIWCLLRRRVAPSLAIGLTAVLVLCGSAYENFIFPIQIGQVGSLLGGLIAWVLLDGDSRAQTAGITAAVAFSLASSAIGVAVLVGVGIEVLVRRQWALVAGMTGLAVLFAIWYLNYGYGNGFFAPSHVPSFLAGIAAYTLTGTLGLWPLYHLAHGTLMAAGLVLALVIVGLSLMGSRRGWWSGSDGSYSRGALAASAPRIAGLLAMLGVYWGLTSLARAGLTPYRSRYMHPGAIVLVLILAELLRGRRLSYRSTALGLLACAGIVALGVPYLIHNAAKYREESSALSAQVGALDLVGPEAPPDFRPAPESDPQIRAGPLFRAQLALSSSPGYPPARITKQSRSARLAADTVLLRLSARLLSSSASSCASDGQIPLTSQEPLIAGKPLIVHNTSHVAVRIGLARFSSSPIWLQSSLAPGRSEMVRTESDAYALPWRIYTSPSRRVSVCDPAVA